MGCQWSAVNEIEIFRKYLQIPSVHPNVDYAPCVKFLQRQANNLGLPCTILRPGGLDKPIVLMTWKGTQPNEPAILLNSHMDVVAAIAEDWTYPPFSAHIDSDGRIFARGTQDMKGVGMQYLAAIRSLRQKNIKLKRTIHVLYVPDEEIGGTLGMVEFVKTPEFKALNIGFALDEGRASPTNVYDIFYGERTLWHVTFQCNGPTGHGSQLFENTAGEKLTYIANKFMEFRREQVKKLKDNPNLNTGDVTTVNLNMLRGGEYHNIIPPRLCASFDMRFAMDVSLTEFEETINKWVEEAGGEIDIIFVLKHPYVPPTSLDESNKYWKALKETLTVDLNLQIKTQIHTGATDIRQLRELNIPSIGFSPINNTTYLAHGNDEHLSVKSYLRGIEIYESILTKVANV